MTSIKVLLNNYRESKDGYYPLVIQLLHKRRKRVIYTPYRLREENFEKKKAQVISRRGSKVLLAKEINEYLYTTLGYLEVVISNLQIQKPDYSVEDVVDSFKLSQNNISLENYFNKVINLQKDERRFGTANAYKSTLMCICKFSKDFRHIHFEDITVKWVNDFYSYLHKSMLSVNSINFYFRIFRAVYNKALSEGIPGVNPSSPFKHISLKSAVTAKRAIDTLDISAIAKSKFPNNQQLEFTRDLFLFSFFCRGMPFVDMFLLKKSDISNNVIYYYRRKTKQPLQIKIITPLQKIIDRYFSETEYVLPLMDPEAGPPYKQYRSCLRRYNNDLKKISCLLNLNSLLTSYVARHSWATMAKKSGIPVSVISEGLGHKSEKITYTYLASLDPEVIDSANEHVANLLLSTGLTYHSANRRS